jgi:predicted transcriptional regulator
VADVMRTGLITCQPETRLRGVAQAMAANHIHALVVMDPGSDDPAGSWRVIYDVDVLKLAARGQDARAIDAACTPVTIGMDASAKEAAELMH